MTSILTAFHLATMKVLVAKGLVTREELVDEFTEIRKVVGHQSPIAAAEKEVLDFLEIKEEEESDGA